MEAPTSADDYARAGYQYKEAWDILAADCEFPPSLEVFRYEIERHRQIANGRVVTPQAAARIVAKNYRQQIC